MSAPQRRAMRKGTRCCSECRRRKIKCIFRPEDPSACVDCKTRGAHCVEQWRDTVRSASFYSKQDLQKKVANLEAIIESLVPGAGSTSSVTASFSVQPTVQNATPASSILNATSSITKSPSHSSASFTLSSYSSHLIDPIASLFDNAIWKRSDTETNPNPSPNNGVLTRLPKSHTESRTHSKRLITREALLSGLPHPELLADILNATSFWFNFWKPLGVWLLDSMGDAKPKTLQHFVVWAFNSEDPSIVGLAILCIGASIRLLKSDVHQSLLDRLSCPPRDLFQELFEKVDRLIINDIDYSSTMEGIEVMAMSTSLLVDLGLIKKAWVLLHRTIACAQLLGLHRSQPSSANETNSERGLRHMVWSVLCQRDNYISLLLGLPYASDGKTLSAETLGSIGTVPYFQYALIGISARITDRNQMDRNLSVIATQDIQRDLEILSYEMNQSFWESPAALASGKITREEYLEQITAQFWYHQIRVFLHMPLMIESVEDSQLEIHRQACLDACRDILKIYYIMRAQSSSAFSMIKIIDYQSFLCSSLLLLGILGYGATPSHYQLINQNRDRELVNQTLDTLRQESTMSGNLVASQALQGLETLTLLTGPRCKNKDGKCPYPYIRIVVPYAGTVTISPGTFLTKSRSESPPSTMDPRPNFALTHGNFQLLDNAETGASEQLIGSQGGQLEQEMPDSELALVPEFLSIDFDWGNLAIGDSSKDWEWLDDVNPGEIVDGM